MLELLNKSYCELMFFYISQEMVVANDNNDLKQGMYDARTLYYKTWLGR